MRSCYWENSVQQEFSVGQGPEHESLSWFEVGVLDEVTEKSP